MSRGSQFALLVLFIPIFCQAAVQTAIYDELNDSQKANLQKGEQVVLSQEIGKPWPKVTVYQRLDATPEESMAVMADCDRHLTFFKDILRSTISQRLSKSTFIVDYTLHLPWPLPDEKYTLKDQLSLTSNRSTYLLNWTMVRADTTHDIQGNVRFETLGTGSIMAYQNLVVPDSQLASLMKGRAIQAVKDAAHSLVKQIYNEKKKNPDLLQNQIHSLKEALDL